MVAINRNVFREYDIRGTVGVDLNQEFCYLLGRALVKYIRSIGTVAAGDKIVIGYDCRLSSHSFALELAKGINEEGVDAEISGMGPTPQLYFASRELGATMAVQVTGSHNPPDMNGFKISYRNASLSGSEISQIYEKMIALPCDSQQDTAKGETREIDFAPKYLQMLCDRFYDSRVSPTHRKLKIVADAGNGVGGMIGLPALRSLGHEVIDLYCDPDGRFPNHHPDPSVPESLKDLVKTVRDQGADFGVAWDGDGDRIGVVDGNGNIIAGDMLVYIYAKDLLTRVPDATVIADVKCSDQLFSQISKLGGNAIMWKTGHSLIKKKLYEEKALLAGEMSGHIFFAERYHGYDDAVFAALLLADIVSRAQDLASLLKEVPELHSTPEIRVDCPEDLKFRIPEILKEKFAGKYVINDIDGCRISFENGWGLVRASNTQAVLVMRFEATEPRYLEEYKSLMVSAVERAIRDC